MAGRRIPAYQVPHCAGKQADDSAGPKRGSPAEVNHDVGDQRRRQARSRTYASEDPAISQATLRFRNPAGDKLIRGRIDNRLSGSEQKADTDEQNQCPRNRGGTAAVSAGKTPHPITPTVNTKRGPSLSARTPPGV